MIRADDAKAGSTVFKINRSCSASKMNEMWQSTHGRGYPSKCSS